MVASKAPVPPKAEEELEGRAPQQVSVKAIVLSLVALTGGGGGILAAHDSFILPHILDKGEQRFEKRLEVFRKVERERLEEWKKQHERHTHAGAALEKDVNASFERMEQTLRNVATRESIELLGKTLSARIEALEKRVDRMGK